ncbi:MAG: serine hydrolase [Gemmatimonadetes bacterium]|nr:serine hydrolase [Gemmatimonadota bacterium]
MTHRSRLPFAVLVPALIATTVVDGAAAQADSASLAAQTDEVFAQWDKPDSPGCVCAVMREGEVVYSRGYGMADLQHDVPMTPSTPFSVASLSKVFTGASIALLALEGKLALDDDIRTYIPEMPDYGTPITIRHLVHHTSGIREQQSLLSMAGWRVYEGDHVTERDVVELLARQRSLNFAPGESMLYSNSGYTLLAVIVKRVSGKTLREFADERIFRPLEMTSTHFHDDHRHIVKGRAAGYLRPREGGGYRISMSLSETVGPSGLVTTVEDLAKWERNFFEPRVGGSDLIDLLHTRGRLNNGRVTNYAFHWQDIEYKGLRAVSAGGGSGGYSSHYLRFPDQSFSVVTLCNLGSADVSGLSRQVADLYLTNDFVETEPAEVTDQSIPGATETLVSEEELARYAGLYWDEETESLDRIAVVDGKLKSTISPIGLIPLGNREFQMVGRPIRFTFSSPGAGEPLRMQRSYAGSETLDLAAVVEAETTTATELAEYAGRYYSEELDNYWTFIVHDGQLVLSRGIHLTRYNRNKLVINIASRRLEVLVFQRIFSDTFTGHSPGPFLLRFTRDQGERVTSFTASTSPMGWARRVRFVKQLP